MGRRGPRGAGYGNAIASPLYFRHPASLEHDTGPHPESAERIVALEAALEARDWLGWEVREAPRATKEQLLRVHPQLHVDSVRRHSEEGAAFDLDTPTSVGSWEAALRSAGAACAMVDALMTGEAPAGFCGTRPPGHHAEPARAMGFCLFCNVAVAARHARAAHGAERVMVLDWDVHHGNGTHAAFYSDRAVLFASLHQWPFYPGTGALGENGSGPGEGFTINLPVPAGSGEEEWLGLVEHVVVPAGREFAPQLILVSAGFDAHRGDPLADCELETSTFNHLARHVRGLADELEIPVGAVLEGGYDLRALPESAIAAMEGLQHGGEPRAAEAGPLVSASAEHVARWWPSVGAATA